MHKSRVIIICFLTLMLVSATIKAQTVVAPDSYEGQEIIKAIEVLRSAGGNPGEQGSPAWMANNINTYLESGNIVINDLPEGELGRNDIKDGPVQLSPLNFLPSEATGGIGVDLKNSDQFKQLVSMTSIIAQHKYHSETHGTGDRIGANLRRLLDGKNPMEAKAWLFAINFLDNFVVMYSDNQCKPIPVENIEDGLVCIDQVNQILKVKKENIEQYNLFGYGETIPQEYISQLDEIILQLDAIKASSNPEGYSAVEQNLKAFEAGMVALLGTYHETASKEALADTLLLAPRTAKIVSFVTDFSLSDPAIISLVMEVESVLSLSDGNHEVLIKHPGSNTQAETESSNEIDYTLEIDLETYAEIYASDSPETTAQELYADGRFKVQSGSSSGLSISSNGEFIPFLSIFTLGIIIGLAISILLLRFYKGEKSRLLRILLILMVVFIVLMILFEVTYFLLFGEESEPTPSQIDVTEIPTNTLIPTDTLTLPTPTLVPTIIEVTDTPAIEPTATEIIVSETTVPTTPAVVYPIATSFADSNCRSGPDTIFEIVGYFLAGEQSEIHGRNPDQTWWYIRNPDIAEGFCWVLGDLVSVEGDTSGVPVVTPPSP